MTFLRSFQGGGGLQGSGGHTYYKQCLNSNSIGIEMCSRISNGTYYFKDETITNCIELTRYLMTKYNVPVSRVIRHYDVTGKNCPEPFVRDSSQWTNFKNRLVSESIKPEHWCKQYLDLLINKGIITDKNIWSKYDEPINKALTICLLDKITGGMWLSNEDDTSIHWAQPNVISLCGKGIIHEPDEWIKTLNNNISKALLLALICNVTGGVSNLYKNRVSDHWARNCLDTLCDRGIIQTPQSWTDFEAEVSKGLTMAIFCKTFYK